MDLTSKTNREQRKVIPLIQSGEYFFRRGLKAYRKNHVQRAIKYFERAVKLTSTEPVFHVQLAAVLSEIGEYDRSNDILHRVLAEEGDQIAECYFFIANNFAYSGHFEKAERAALKYLELQPNDRFSPDAEDLLDLIQFERDEGDWEELDIEENELITSHERARYLLRKGDVHASIPIFEEIIAEHPTCWAAMNHLAEAFFRIGDARAFTLCEDILREDKGNLLAVCNLALFYTKKGKVKEAAFYVEAMKNVFPLDIDHCIKIAETLCAVKEYKHAYERLKKLDLEELEYRPSLLYCLGVTLLHLDERKRGRDYILRAAALKDEQAMEYMKEDKKMNSEEAVYNLWID